MSARGYVVRGKDRDKGDDLWAMVHKGLSGATAVATEERVFATEYPTPTRALAAAVQLQEWCEDVVILAVDKDGTETPIPSYEEALARLDMVDDILAATGRPGDGDTLVARVGHALDDEDIPGEEQAKIAAATNLEWWRASNTTQGSESARIEAANVAQRKAYADGRASYRAARRTERRDGRRM